MLGLGGVHRRTGSGTYVVMTSDVIDYGPETGRVVYIELTPHEARQRAKSLLWSADEVDRLNKVTADA